MTTSRFIRDSIGIIRENQARSGAFLASPGFSHYQYSWLRDGTFIAYAMDLVDEHQSALRFYQWCNRVVLQHANKARQIIQRVLSGEKNIDSNLFLHTRFSVDGNEVTGEWGNFQLDGYGAWLWGLSQHLQLTEGQGMLPMFRQAIEVTIDYLSACWRLPNFDCWEEHGDQVHSSTLAAIYGGLAAISSYLPERQKPIVHLCEQIRKFVSNECVTNGLFDKSAGSPNIDSSLIWLSVPYGLVEVNDIRMIQTVRGIERELLYEEGLHRYKEDTYFGGGQWILLSAWLGWYYTQLGERDKAHRILAWIEDRYTSEGLSEQVQDHLLAPRMYEKWVNQVGLPAKPLLWSHAMYLILASALGSGKR
ncbi:glycoside hydrolase family 15 protein [Brevibacillus sp. SYSU BS000544]|uniref:glycoside hydrolase family 15 protein n=1 Tax=Brevibacillus sp. SYSU BS000544 TaxID=3416443 RepID=UPI003CE56794